MQRQAGAGQRCVCGSGGRVEEVSKCRAVLGTAFAGVRRVLNGRMTTGGQCWPASVGLGSRQIVQTERSGVQRLCGFLLSLIPPQLKSINQKVTGLVACAKKQERFSSNLVKYTARKKLFLVSHIMILCFDFTRLPV